MIKNGIELEKKLSKPITLSIKDVSKSMIILLRELINTMTYGMPEGLPNNYYYDGTNMPTFQFRNAFQFSPIDFVFNEVETELFYNWEEMDYDGDTQLHGYIDVDNRERLAEILNVDTEQVTQESLVGTAVVVQKKREPYWDEFIGRMYYEEELEKLIDNALKKRFGALGITLIKN